MNVEKLYRLRALGATFFPPRHLLGDHMGEAIEKLGGSIMNLVLGALIVWVGQTTFQHAGILATVSEKFDNVDQQFVDVEKRQESLRKWLDNVVTDMKDSSRAQFTIKEGDKLVSQIRQVESSTLDLERKFAARLTDLEVRLAALQVNGQCAPQVAALQTEVAQMRYAIMQSAAATASTAATYQPAASLSQQPVYLPPVGSRR